MLPSSAHDDAIGVGSYGVWLARFMRAAVWPCTRCAVRPAKARGVFMGGCDNLLIAFWIHFCCILSLRLFVGGVYFFAVISVLYAAVALGLLCLARVPGRARVSMGVG